MPILSDLEQRILSSQRLESISEKVGFTLWQIQQLEEVIATTYVLLCKAHKGMGEEAGFELEKLAKHRTFGNLMHKLMKEKVLPPTISGRLNLLLKERNWLVHRSRGDSRKAIYSDDAMCILLMRLDSISEEALLLIKELGNVVKQFVTSHGATEEEMQGEFEKILVKWRE